MLTHTVAALTTTTTTNPQSIDLAAQVQEFTHMIGVQILVAIVWTVCALWSLLGFQRALTPQDQQRTPTGTRRQERPAPASRWNAASYRYQVTLTTWQRHRDEVTLGHPRYPLLHDLEDPTTAAAVLALATAEQVLGANPDQAHTEADRRSPAWRAVIDAETKVYAALTKARRQERAPAALGAVGPR